jgi:hypothetical protein
MNPARSRHGQLHRSSVRKALLPLLVSMVHAGRLPLGILLSSPSAFSEIRTNSESALGTVRHQLHNEAFGGSGDQTRFRYPGRKGPLCAVTKLRGGDVSDGEDESYDSDGEDTNDSDEEEEAEIAAVPESRDPQSEPEDESEAHPLSSVISMEPVPITIKTSLGTKALDHIVELTVHRSRNIASLKLSASRQLPGRPPVSVMHMLLNGKVLSDEMLLDELLDDDDEKDDTDGTGSESQLTLTLDMLPPVDPKFVGQLESQMKDMTTAELLGTFAANEAALYQNAALLLAEQMEPVYDDDQVEVGISEVATHPPPLVNVQVREQAARIRRDLESKILASEHSQKILADPLPPSAKLADLQRVERRGQRVRRVAGSGGVTTGLKRSIQKNLNVHWGDAIRNFCLFLFFGYFGGRTPVSRAILLLGAPSVFVLQARPVKLWIKCLMYAMLDHPPGIFLSLLPAPQQAILSLNVGKGMKTIYGNALTNTVVNEVDAEPEELADLYEITDVITDGEDDDEFYAVNEYESNYDDDDDDNM